MPITRREFASAVAVGLPSLARAGASAPAGVSAADARGVYARAFRDLWTD